MAQTVKSRLVNGIIIPPTHLELIATDHCNITCRNCNHASPVMPAWWADPEKVHRDFSIMAKWYRPAFVKVLGGEPLLHRRLVEVIEAARSTGISNRFCLTTNGSLLHTASDALWRAIDEIEISLYPRIKKSEENIPLARKKAEQFGVQLTLCQYEQFRTTFSLQGTTDSTLINNIYNACRIANVWGCHAVRDGYFHKCPQSIYVPILRGLEAKNDRLAIVNHPSFQENLLAFINSPFPLASCAFCVGTVGKLTDHSVLPRRLYREDLDHPLSHLVDNDWMQHCLIAQDTIDDCKIPLRLRGARFFATFPCLRRVASFLSLFGADLYTLVHKWRPPQRRASESLRHKTDK